VFGDDDARYYCNERPIQYSCTGRDSNPGKREKKYKFHAPSAVSCIIIAGTDIAVITQTGKEAVGETQT
jgi:hypothetical protein